MPRKWIEDLNEMDEVDEQYVVLRKAMPVTRNNRPYLNLQLGDRTGRVEARVWDNAEALSDRFELHDVVRVRGRAIRYQDHIQINVTAIEKVAEADLDQAVFLPASRTPADELWSGLSEAVSSVHNPHLHALLVAVLQEADVAARLRKGPAAKTVHHARLGGLLEHILSLCTLADRVCDHYTNVFAQPLDRDLLIAGAILHDLGKIWELDPDRAFEYTDRGRLLGHVAMTYHHVGRRIEEINGFPEPLATHLLHMILSHHGELSFGSPKRPKTAEAWLLHFLDIMDGHLTWLNEQTGSLEPGQWTGYQRLHDRYFWKPPRDEAAADGLDRAPTDAPNDAPEGDAGTRRPGRGTGPQSGRQTLLKVSLAERLAGAIRKPEDPE